MIACYHEEVTFSFRDVMNDTLTQHAASEPPKVITNWQSSLNYSRVNTCSLLVPSQQCYAMFRLAKTSIQAGPTFPPQKPNEQLHLLYGYVLVHWIIYLLLLAIIVFGLEASPNRSNSQVYRAIGHAAPERREFGPV